MDIVRAESVRTRRASSEYFTGTVWQDPLWEAPDPARIRVVRVAFEPGARTHWHTHPLGQTLLVVSGVGRAQIWGGAVQVLRPGDTVWFPPGEKHWHGAGPESAMSHVALHEHIGGNNVTWLEAVGDEQYAVAPG